MLGFIKSALGQSAPVQSTKVVHSSTTAMDALIQLQKDKEEELKRMNDEVKARDKLAKEKEQEAKLKQETMMRVVQVQASIKAAMDQLHEQDAQLDSLDKTLEAVDNEVWEFINTIRNI
jgi:hypothetical protein